VKKHEDPRHQARRIAVQALFEWLFMNNETNPMPRLQAFLEELKESQADPNEYELRHGPHDQKLLEDLIQGVIKERRELDRIVAECAPEWPLEQIAKVDLSILRIAVFELLHLTRTPTKVAIDEAVELAKEFGGDNSSKFVNGVLGTVVKNYVVEEKSTEASSKPLEATDEVQKANLISPEAQPGSE
jgi:N utilization substance protein B